MREYDARRFNELPGQEVFFHLLRCPSCRDMALAQFGVHKAASEPPPPAPPPKKPIVSKEAEWLFDGLLRLSSRKRTAALKDPRYHRTDLLDLILERSEEAQAEDLSRADELAWLAVSLATDIDADDVRLRQPLVRAFCLAGNARRMKGDLSMAEAAFDNASFFLSGDARERGLYSRALALLRWDQGRLDETAALLRYAACAYGEEDSVEEGACLALLGLLYTEAEEFFPAIGPLMRAQLALSPGWRHLWLLVRATYCLILCLAEEGRPEDVRDLMGTAAMETEPLRRLFARAPRDIDELRRIAADLCRLVSTFRPFAASLSRAAAPDRPRRATLSRVAEVSRRLAASCRSGSTAHWHLSVTYRRLSATYRALADRLRAGGDRFRPIADRQWRGADRLWRAADRLRGLADRQGRSADRPGPVADRLWRGADRLWQTADRLKGVADRLWRSADRFGEDADRSGRAAEAVQRLADTLWKDACRSSGLAEGLQRAAPPPNTEEAALGGRRSGPAARPTLPLEKVASASPRGPPPLSALFTQVYRVDEHKREA